MLNSRGGGVSTVDQYQKFFSFLPLSVAADALSAHFLAESVPPLAHEYVVQTPPFFAVNKGRYKVYYCHGP